MSDEPEQFSTDCADVSLADFGEALGRAIGVYWLADKLLGIVNWWEARRNV